MNETEKKISQYLEKTDDKSPIPDYVIEWVKAETEKKMNDFLKHSRYFGGLKNETL